jgi:hypothetical protein
MQTKRLGGGLVSRLNRAHDKYLCRHVSGNLRHFTLWTQPRVRTDNGSPLNDASPVTPGLGANAPLDGSALHLTNQQAKTASPVNISAECSTKQQHEPAHRSSSSALHLANQKRRRLTSQYLCILLDQPANDDGSPVVSDRLTGEDD